MFLSILQLISSFTLMVGSSGNFDNQTYSTTKYSLPPISAHLSRDDLSVLSYEISFNPFGNDFIQNEWEKGLNLANPSYTYTDFNNNTGYLINDCVEAGVYYNFSLWSDNYNNFSMNLYRKDNPSSVTLRYLSREGSNINLSQVELDTYNCTIFARNVDTATFDTNFNLMIVLGTTPYSYQPYHSDSELFDAQYDYSIYEFDFYDSVEGIYYPNFLSLNVYFSFATRVQFDSIGNYYYFDLNEFYFGIYKWDYDNDFPHYPYMNYFLYSNGTYNGRYIDDSFYSEKKVPLIYGSADPYDINHYHLDDDSYDLHCYSDDFIEFNVNFEYIDSASFDLLTQGMFGMSGNFIDGYNQGYKVGYDEGYNNGLYEGTKLETQEAYDNGYQQGFSDGMDEVIDTGQTASIIFNGIISVGLLPTNVFLKMLNLEVFGINIGALVSSLLTIMVIIIVVRMIFGGKNEV